MTLEWIDTAARFILGLNLLFFGLNGFTHWVQIPKGEPAFEEFIEALVKAKFIMPAVKVLEIIIGLMLITNRSVLLALAMIAPILFVIAGSHLVLNQQRGLLIVSSLVLPFAFLIYYRHLEIMLLLLGLR